MTAPASNAPRAATLDDLAALNREMAALVAAGLPLEEGLRQVARDYRGDVGPLAAQLAEGVAAGQSLDAAIAAQGDAFPPIYRAVVLAGLKSGHLAAALEGYAESAARVAALRRTVGQAAVYPLLVVIIAWLMFLATVCLVIPAYDWLGWNDRFWTNSFRPAPSTAWSSPSGNGGACGASRRAASGSASASRWRTEGAPGGVSPVGQRVAVGSGSPRSASASAWASSVFSSFAEM